MANDETPVTPEERIARELARVRKGGAEKYHEKNAEQGKLFARERLRLLARRRAPSSRTARSPTPWIRSCPPTAWSPGSARIDGRTGRGHGQRLDGQGRLVGRAARSRRSSASRRRRPAMRVPLFYLVDSAGARITDQIEMFPGRRGAGRIFYNQVQLSGVVPQICLLFGPSAAAAPTSRRSATWSSWSKGNASMYLGSPRMAEMVIGEKVTLEEMGGARMHCSVSGCGDVLVQDRGGGDRGRRGATSPTSRRASGSCRPRPPRRAPRVEPASASTRSSRSTRTSPSTCSQLIDALVDEGIVLRGEEALRRGARHRLRAHRGAAGRASSPTSPSARAACSSSTRPTRRRASSGCATPSTSRCSTWPTCPAS